SRVSPGPCVGQDWLTSLATIAPEARGGATAGVAKFGSREGAHVPTTMARRRRVWRRSTRTPFFLRPPSPTPNMDSDIKERSCLSLERTTGGRVTAQEGANGYGTDKQARYHGQARFGRASPGTVAMARLVAVSMMRPSAPSPWIRA